MRSYGVSKLSLLRDGLIKAALAGSRRDERNSKVVTIKVARSLATADDDDRCG